MKFWIGLIVNSFCWGGHRFFTKSKWPRLCNLASDSITLFKGLNMKERTTAAILFLILIETDLLITSCSISSLMLMISVCSSSLQILQSWYLIHLQDISLPAFLTSSKIFKFLAKRLQYKCSTFICSLLGSKISSALDMKSLKKSSSTLQYNNEASGLTCYPAINNLYWSNMKCVILISYFDSISVKILWGPLMTTLVPSAFLNRDQQMVSPDSNWNTFSGYYLRYLMPNRRSVRSPTSCSNFGEFLALLLLIDNGGNSTVIWSIHTPLNNVSEPLNSDNRTWKISWLHFITELPTLPIDTGIDNSCTPLEPIDFTASYSIVRKFPGKFR